jgi:hypothetical protein
MISPITNRVVLHSGGATSPTIELYQRRSGRCRLWTYCFDQDGQESETIAAFREPDWAKARLKAKDLLKAALGTGLLTKKSVSNHQSRLGTQCSPRAGKTANL